MDAKILFPGDLILGTPSVQHDVLMDYMKSLHRVKRMRFDWIYLSHHVPDDTNPTHGIKISAKEKIDNYIDHRTSKELKMMKALCEGMSNCQELFDFMYSDIDLTDPLRKQLCDKNFLA